MTADHRLNKESNKVVQNLPITLYKHDPLKPTELNILFSPESHALQCLMAVKNVISSGLNFGFHILLKDTVNVGISNTVTEM